MVRQTLWSFGAIADDIAMMTAVVRASIVFLFVNRNVSRCKDEGWIPPNGSLGKDRLLGTRTRVLAL